MSDWPEFHDDHLVEIARHIKLYDDFVSFRSVCSSWRLAANIKKNFMYKSDQMPLLMFPTQPGTDEFAFFNLSKAITRRVSLPEAKDKTCFSSKGWLLTITLCRLFRLRLSNPVSRALIELPTSENWKSDIYDACNFFQKFVLSSSNLLESDYIVMVIYGTLGELAYIRSGKKSWTTVHMQRYNLDVIYYQDKFYAINHLGRILVCDLSGENTNPTVAQEAAVMPYNLLDETAMHQYYLVESDGALLVVSREVGPTNDDPIYATRGFRVFKVDLVPNTWMEIKDIGNRALFLGHNSSLSIQVLDSSVCDPNCIYFTADSPDYFNLRQRRRVIQRTRGLDMGIYNIKDGSIIPYVTFGPSMWVERTFN